MMRLETIERDTNHHNKKKSLNHMESLSRRPRRPHKPYRRYNDDDVPFDQQDLLHEQELLCSAAPSFDEATPPSLVEEEQDEKVVMTSNTSRNIGIHDQEPAPVESPASSFFMNEQQQQQLMATKSLLSTTLSSIQNSSIQGGEEENASSFLYDLQSRQQSDSDGGAADALDESNISESGDSRESPDYTNTPTMPAVVTPFTTTRTGESSASQPPQVRLTLASLHRHSQQEYARTSQEDQRYSSRTSSTSLYQSSRQQQTPVIPQDNEEVLFGTTNTTTTTAVEEEMEYHHIHSFQPPPQEEEEEEQPSSVTTSPTTTAQQQQQQQPVSILRRSRQEDVDEDVYKSKSRRDLKRNVVKKKQSFRQGTNINTATTRVQEQQEEEQVRPPPQEEEEEEGRGVSFGNEHQVHRYEQNEEELTQLTGWTGASSSMNSSTYSKSMESEVEDLVKDFFFLGQHVEPGRRHRHNKSMNDQDEDYDDGSITYTTDADSATFVRPTSSCKSVDSPQDGLYQMWSMMQGGLDAMGTVLGIGDDHQDDSEEERRTKNKQNRRDYYYSNKQRRGDASSKQHGGGGFRERASPSRGGGTSSQRRRSSTLEDMVDMIMQQASDSSCSMTPDRQCVGRMTSSRRGRGSNNKKDKSAFSKFEKDMRLSDLALWAARSKHEVHGLVLDESSVLDIVSDVKFSVSRVQLPMGVLFQENAGGCWVTKVFSSGTGIEEGDQLAAINGKSAMDMKVDTFCAIVSDLPKDATVELTFLRYVGKMRPTVREEGYEVRDPSLVDEEEQELHHPGPATRKPSRRMQLWNPRSSSRRKVRGEDEKSTVPPPPPPTHPPPPPLEPATTKPAKRGFRLFRRKAV